MFPTRFQMQLEHGFCVGVTLPSLAEVNNEEALFSTTHPDEVRFASEFALRRKITFAGGRRAMAVALEHMGHSASPILSDDRGAPLMPSGFVGSLSHKDALAVALVASDENACVGVDIEPLEPERPRITRLVLTDSERRALGDGPPWREVLLRFSLKESIYKAIDPFVRRYVTFKEVEVTPQPNGEVKIQLQLERGEALNVAGRWIEHEGYFITTCRASRR